MSESYPWAEPSYWNGGIGYTTQSYTFTQPYSSLINDHSIYLGSTGYAEFQKTMIDYAQIYAGTTWDRRRPILNKNVKVL
jgi:hypothetical protein